MGGIAKHQRTEELHPANEANSEEKYLCPYGCDAPVSHVRSYIRDTPSGDNARVSPHFRFYDCEHGMQTERSASAGKSSGGGSGESPLHRRRKVQAMNTLLDVFETERYTTECYIGEKRCDAMVLLSDPHEQYGKGFVVEYQHKNEQKDIEAVERHYASHNFTTLWLWEDQFTFSGLVPDVDLFGGRVFKPWPQVVPDCEEWSGTANRHRLRAMIGAGTTTRVDATLKRSFTLPTEREYWHKRPWLKRFRFNMSNGEIAGEVPVDSYLKIIHNDLETHIPATIPPEYVDTKIYTGLNWDSIEPVTDSAARYRLRAAVGSGTTTRVDATLRMSFILQSEQEYWRQQPWRARFGFSAYNQHRMDDINCTAWRYQDEVADTSETSGSDAKLPPEYVDTKIYNQLDWDSIGLVAYPEVLASPPCQTRQVPVTIPQPAIDDLQVEEHANIRNAQLTKLEQLGRIRGKIRANPQITTHDLDAHFNWDRQTTEMRIRSLTRRGIISGSDSEGWIYNE